MGGGKSAGGGEAEKARSEEQKRQASIREGTARINTIFDGGLTPGTAIAPTGKALNFDSGDYYDVTGKKLTGSITGFDNEKVYGTPGAPVAGSFGEDFFAGRKKAFMDYASPQLEDQYGDAQKELTFALARNGTLDSSIRGQKAGELQKTYDLNKQQVADKALSYETDARNSVEDARSNLIATLNATGDAQGAANSALSRAAALSQAPAYSPLTNLFGDFTSTLGTQAALEKANYYSGGQTGARYSTGLFAPSASSVVNK